MIRIEHYGDVLRIEMASLSGRLVGYTASAYLSRGVMVDCGFPLARHHVAAVLERYRPRGVFLTHHHEDHAGNVALVVRSGVPISASDETLARVRAPAPVRLYRRVTWGSVDAVVAPIVPFEASDMSLLPAPGHSSDHHVVWDASDGTLFGGDLYLGVKVRVAHPKEDPRVLAATLRRIAALGPSRLFDAHRGFVPNPVPLLVAKADWTEEMIAAIERRVDAGAPDSTIVREVFGGESLPGYFSGGEYSRANFVTAVRRGLTSSR